MKPLEERLAEFAAAFLAAKIAAQGFCPLCQVRLPECWHAELMKEASAPPARRV